ncbi:hypothetical protein ACJX0J_026964, partial [Zea mays]
YHGFSSVVLTSDLRARTRNFLRKTATFMVLKQSTVDTTQHPSDPNLLMIWSTAVWCNDMLIYVCFSDHFNLILFDFEVQREIFEPLHFKMKGFCLL